MYSNSIVKIEACDEAIDDEPEVDPFMDISLLRSSVKLEVTEGVLAHSSLDLKPELPIPPVQNEEEFHPGEFLQVKIEETDDQNSQFTTFNSEPSNSAQIQPEIQARQEQCPPKNILEYISRKNDKSLVKWSMNPESIDFIVNKYYQNRPHSLVPILEADFKGNRSLVYLPQQEVIRCERCHKAGVATTGVGGKGVSLKSQNGRATINQRIVEHFISDSHSEVVKSQINGEEFTEKNQEIVVPEKSEEFVEKFSKTSKKAAFIPIKSNVPTPSDGTSPIDPNMIRRMGIKLKSFSKLLMDDWEGDRCWRFIPNGSNPKNGALRCEACYRDPIVIGCSWKLRGLVASKEGISLSKLNTRTRIFQKIITHLNATRHLEAIKTRNFGVESPAQSSNPFIPNGVKIERKDELDGSRDIEMEAVDIKQEFQDLIPQVVKSE